MMNKMSLSENIHSTPVHGATPTINPIALDDTQLNEVQEEEEEEEVFNET
jgi:hypothetical protein